MGNNNTLVYFEHSERTRSNLRSKTTRDAHPATVNPSLYAKLAAIFGVGVGILATTDYPFSLPFGVVISKPSVAEVACYAVFAAVAVRVVVPLREMLPPWLMMATVASTPITTALLLLLWGMPVTHWVLLATLPVGLATFAGSHRSAAGRMVVACCTSLFVLALCLLVILFAGRMMYPRYPSFFSTGYALVDGSVKRGAIGPLAEELATSIASIDGESECAAVSITPYGTNFEGIFMSWDESLEGERMLVVASEYVACFDVDDLKSRAAHMLSVDDGTAFLFTQWLDGRLWIWLNESFVRS